MRAIKDLFIPNTRNKYMPHSLQTAALIGMSLLVLLSFAIANVQSILWLSSDWMVSTILPAVLVTETNEERTDRNVSPLVRSDTLDRAATLKAEHMAAYEYFAHFSPEGVSPWHWFEEVGYNFIHAGENLAIYFTDSSEVVDAWMNSPLHRDNILKDEYREIGIGVARGSYEGYETVYVVQLFGTPAATFFRELTTPAIREVGIETSNESITQQEPIVAGASDSVREDVSLHTVIAPDGETVVIRSDHVSISQGGIPAHVSVDTEQVGQIGFERYVTQPSVVLQVIYLIVALFVFTALTLSVFVEIKRQQPVQIMYSLILLLGMVLLFELHTTLSMGLIT